MGLRRKFRRPGSTSLRTGVNRTRATGKREIMALDMCWRHDCQATNTHQCLLCRWQKSERAQRNNGREFCDRVCWCHAICNLHKLRSQVYRGTRIRSYQYAKNSLRQRISTNIGEAIRQGFQSGGLLVKV